jgi:xanthine dehydrogenase accessory factor
VVVATHGEVDEAMLARVLGMGAGYVSLVASRKRAAAVMESLRAAGVPRGELDRLKAPAGLDIGAVTPTEIAVSILAEIIQLQRSGKWGAPAATPAAAPISRLTLSRAEAIDPVCGMTVDPATARHRSEHGDRTAYFCCGGCKAKFDASPERYT